MSDEVKPLTHCPVCRYDLKGLPANHRCPECGFEYDETMRMYRRSVSGWIKLWTVVLFLFLVMPSLVGVSKGNYISVLPALCVLLSLNIGIKRYRPGSVLVIADKGLYVMEKDRKMMCYAWSQLWLPSEFRPWPATVKGALLKDLRPYASVYHLSPDALIDHRIPLPSAHARRSTRRAVYREIYDAWVRACEAEMSKTA